jgi:phosphate starvation-inducible protein PhoH
MNIFTIFTCTFVMFRKDGLRINTQIYMEIRMWKTLQFTHEKVVRKKLMNDNGVGEIVGHFVREERMENEVIERWEGIGGKTAEF